MLAPRSTPADRLGWRSCSSRTDEGTAAAASIAAMGTAVGSCIRIVVVVVAAAEVAGTTGRASAGRFGAAPGVAEWEPVGLHPRQMVSSKAFFDLRHVCGSGMPAWHALEPCWGIV